MSGLIIFAYSYLAVGLIYALWIWLFAGATFLSIPVNAVFGPIYILGVLLHFLTWRKKTIYRVFQGKKVVIFDLDGTVIDSQTSWNDAMENVKKRLGFVGLERNYPSGLNVSDKWEFLLRDYSGPVNVSVADLSKATNDEFLKIYTEVEARDGFWTLARYLKERGFKLALASNTERYVVDEVVKRLEAGPVFDLIIAGDEVKHHKPHPEMYRVAVKKLEVSPKDAVIFEDSLIGTQAAIASKIDTIVIWDEEISKVLYPRGAAFFLPDFEGLDVSIEKSPRQLLEEAAKESEESNE